MEFTPVTTTAPGAVRLREHALGVSTQPPRPRVDTPAIYFDKPVADLSPPAYDKGGRAIGGEIRPVLILGVGEDREALEAEARADLAHREEAAAPDDAAPLETIGTPSGEDAPEGVSGPPAEADAEATEASPAEEADADEETSTDPTRPRGADGQVLSDAEVEQIEELKARDREVRAHEQAHKAVGGQHAGAISYDYERGPDGRSYAVGGEVKIDISEVEDDHEATIRKMQQVRRAALAPSEPSAQDRAVAAEASEIEQRARTELRELRSEERSARQEAPESSEETAAVSGDEEASPYAAHTESYGGRVRVDLQASEALTRQRGLFTYRQSV